MIEVTIQHPPDEVREAVVQFCARRGYRLTQPWYLEGMRIEAPERDRNNADERGFWATVMNSQSMPRIDVDIKKRRGTASRVKITLGDNAESTRLAYELQAYLHDDRAYEAACPPICPQCGNNVPNPVARYCGRCGHKFAPHTTSTYDHVLGPPPVVAHEKEPQAHASSESRSERTKESPFTTSEQERYEQAALSSRIDEREVEAEPSPEADANNAESSGQSDDEEAIVDSFDLDAEDLDDSATESPKPTIEVSAEENATRHDAETAAEPPTSPRQAEALSVEADEQSVTADEAKAAEQSQTDDKPEPEDDAQPTRRLLAEE